MSQDSGNDDITRSHLQLSNDTLIGHYRIIEKIGAGGMGEVYLAEDTELNRKVALKLLPPNLCQDAECRTRFKREAQAAAKLNHPNIVTIYEVSEFNGRPFIAMEHVGGLRLDEHLKQKSLSLDKILDLTVQVCEGLREAHRSGIVHRDIKPGNILVDKNDRAKILDFGLATIKGTDKLTKTGSTLGTLSYMSPEQTRGEVLDERSDIFSFGVVLYEMITGRLPFKGDHEPAIIYAIGYEEPEPLARYKTGVPDALQRIVSKALAKSQDERYQHTDDLLADLQTFSKQGLSFKPGKPRGDPWNRYIVTSAAAVILVIVGYWVVTTYVHPSGGKSQQQRKMLAVLPFENLGSPEDEYFADGMTEEITSRLVGIEGLGVISRTSAMQYKRSGKSLRQIGKELGVTYILEGSVRWAKVEGKPRVRITPQLIRVSDDRHLWADNYERPVMEVFAVQEDIATQIVDQLGLTLLESNRTALASRPTANSRAYDYYLRGIIGVRRLDWSLPTLSSAAANLDSAVMIDPSFALAHAVRSRAYAQLAFISASPAFRTVARESFERALKLQPNLSYGHMAAGIYYNLVEDDYERSLTELNQATSELRNDADLIANIAFAQFRQGRFEEALANFAKAVELDPLNPTVHASRSEFLRFNRMYAEAEESIDRAIALDPKRPDYYVEKVLGLVSRYGSWNRVREIVREALANVDTVEFAYLLMSVSGYSHGFSLDSLFAGTGVDFKAMAGRIRSEYRPKLVIDLYYCVLVVWYSYTGNAALTSVYIDSARASLEKRLQSKPDDWQRTSMLSVLFLYMGSCPRAVDMGLRAKELLSIAKCHW
jgi:serine/threonine protein kinase/tetratricopeptide (TPR) repeat protein